MDTLKELFVIVFSLLMGSFLIYLSYLLISDYPPKSSLIWLPASEVTEIRYSAPTTTPHKICFFRKDGQCLSIDSNDEGYEQLQAAIKSGTQYSIGYNKERAIFSSDPTLYKVIYEIRIGGKIVRSYDKHISGLKYLCGGICLTGIFLIGFAIYRLRLIMHQLRPGAERNAEIAERTHAVGYTSHSELTIPMSQSEVWEYLKVFPLILAILIGLTILYKLGSRVGMSNSLTGSALLTLLFLVIAIFNFRKLEKFNQIGLLLLIGGFSVLTAANLVNEYVQHIFTPSYIFILLAVAPSLIFAAYQAYLELRSLNSAVETNNQGRASKSHEWFQIYSGAVHKIDDDNDIFPGLKFILNGLSVYLPIQPNMRITIREDDHIEFCGRPSLIIRNRIVCLAYRINGDNRINAINEWQHLISAVVAIILAVVGISMMGYRWPILAMALAFIYYAVSSYWSFRAKSCLTNA